MEAFWGNGPIWRPSQKQKTEVKETVRCPYAKLALPQQSGAGNIEEFLYQRGEM